MEIMGAEMSSEDRTLMNTKAVLYDIVKERERQDEKWGEQNHAAPVWATIIGEEYGEMCQAINEFMFNPTPENEQRIHEEAIQTAASCVAMCECIIRKNGGVG